MHELREGERLGAIHWYAEFDHDDREGGVWEFAVEHRVGDFETAARKAAAEYVAGLDVKPTCAFNWGDAVNDVSEEVWARYGLRLLPERHADLEFTVDNNEVLWDPGDEDDGEGE